MSFEAADKVCAQCSTLLALLKTAAETLRIYEPESPTADMIDRVVSKVEGA